ncbi:MAG TPA: hypothetical protein VF062_19090 [Candidatus Limnocylindrales bacterium]
MLLKLYCLVRTVRADRGEGPVPYVIIVAVMSAAAAAVAAVIWGVADGWLDDLDNVTNPGGPAQP